MARATIVTHRDKNDVVVSTTIQRPLFDQLEKLCKKRFTTKGAYLRKLIEEEIQRKT